MPLQLKLLEKSLTNSTYKHKISFFTPGSNLEIFPAEVNEKIFRTKVSESYEMTFAHKN